MGQGLEGFFEALVQVIEQRDHVVSVYTRLQRPGFTAFEGLERFADALFVDDVIDLFLIKILEPGVGQNFRQLDFVEQFELDREVIVFALFRQTAETRDQPGGFFTAAAGVHVLDEVHALRAEVGFQRAFGACGECRNQKGLARLRQAEKPGRHRRGRHTAQALGLIARLVQFQAECVGFAVQARGGDTGFLNPVQRLTGTFIHRGPAVTQRLLLRGQVAHLRFTLPLSSQYLLSLKPATSNVLSCSSKSLLRNCLSVFDSTWSILSRSLSCS